MRRKRARLKKNIMELKLKMQNKNLYKRMSFANPQFFDETFSAKSFPLSTGGTVENKYHGVEA